MKKFLLLFSVLFALLMYAYGETIVEATLPEEIRTVEPAEERRPSLTYIYLSGAVRNPGVYSYADSDGINLAESIHDGMHIHVPYKPEGTAVHTDDGKIHLNEADEKALTQLPGIGPAMAAAIVAYRDEHGAFSSVDELKQVKGIGANKYEKLKDCVDL